MIAEIRAINQDEKQWTYSRFGNENPDEDRTTHQTITLDIASDAIMNPHCH